MSAFWSVYIIVLSVAGFALVAFLLVWGLRRRIPTDASGSTGHVWDEDLVEHVNRPPLWWVLWSVGWFVAGVVYLALYPGLGAWGGALGWTQAAEHDRGAMQLAQASERALGAFRGRPLDVLARDPHALQLGGSIYARHCAMCHGPDARGGLGFPDLLDAGWNWGGDHAALLATIGNGRQGSMPALGAALEERGVLETAVFVQSLSGLPADSALASAGRRRFETLCAACHGAQGKGNPTLGAPDLSDDAWQFGGDFASIATSIRDGRSGTMPAQHDTLGDDRVRLVAAWLLAGGARSATAGE